MEPRRSVGWFLQYQQDGRLDGEEDQRVRNHKTLGVKKRKVRKGQS